MTCHQAVAEHAETVLLRPGLESVDVEPPVFVLQEGFLAVGAPLGDVVRNALRYHTRLARQDGCAEITTITCLSPISPISCLIDSNVPMYVIGRPHPYKKASAESLLAAWDSGETLVTDAEVLQEIVHRYSAIRRVADGDDAMSLLLGIVDRVFPIDQFDVAEARRLTSSASDLSARDLLHWAVMRRYGITQILSFDRDFDRCPGIERLC